MDYRISNLLAAIMILVALMLDLTQIFLSFTGAGAIISVILITLPFYLLFGVWFRLLGVNFFAAKNSKSLILGTIIELIPFINDLPALSLMVGLTCLSVRRQDEARAKQKTAPGVQ